LQINALTNLKGTAVTLDKNYLKRQHSSKKYEDKRSAEKERMPSVYISKAQKEMLGTLRDVTGLHQGVLLVLGIDLLTAFHAKGVDISELINVGSNVDTPDDKEKLVTEKIRLFIDSLLSSHKKQ
jgi:hypothetical protein